MKLRLTPRAREDLHSAWRYVAERSETAADALVGRVNDRLLLALDFPLLSTPREHLGIGIREVFVEPYRILYRVEGRALVVHRIVHGARDLGAVEL